MKKAILLSLLTTGHIAMANEVCQGLKIFTEYDSNSAVAVLTTANSQKLFVGGYHVIANRVSASKTYYDLKDTKGNPVSIVTGYKDWLSEKSCGRALCNQVSTKTATVTADGKTEVFVCQK